MAKRKGKRMAKEDRKNNMFWAEGARQEILDGHIIGYTSALEAGWRQERAYLQLVMKHYHALIDWRLPITEEPPRPLPIYDPAAPEVKEVLTPEEEKAKHDALAYQYEV